MSEFFRDLVREKMEKEIETDLAFLNESSKGAQPCPTEEEIGEILALQKKVRKKSRAHRS